MAGDLLIRIRSEDFQVFPERAVLWRAKQALLVSDLHWGREQFMQSRGIPIPDVTLDHEMARLDRVLERARARELWILGDWIHHSQGMGERVLTLMEAWLDRHADAGLRIRFVPGNHDRKISAWLRSEQVEIHFDGITCDGFRFDHDDQNAGPEKDFVICGHLHPAVRLNSAVDAMKLPCFYVREDVAYHPAFSSLAAGAVIEPVPGERVVALTEADAIPLFRNGPP